MHKNGIYQLFIKRFLDIFISFISILILSPIFIILSILIRFKLGYPVIFKQQRIGMNKKEFTIYKFRTMTNSKYINGELLPDELRITKFGKILRSLSLDELPELFNILLGNMSIVGPRPLVVQYLPYFNENENKRHIVRPGLTGSAQVNGRNSITWEERFAYDIQYIEKITLYKDIKIILKTIKTVIKKENIGERNKEVLIDFDIYRTEQRRKKNES